MHEGNVKLSRRQLLAGFGALAAGSLTGWPSASRAAGGTEAFERVPSLALAARKAGLLFGASASKEIFADARYARLYRYHAELLTTDVALKFDYIRWREGQWNFGEADRLLRFCDGNGKQLRGHALIWNENAPEWLRRRPGREVARIFDEHIDRVVTRYAGRLHSWDVVNEPFWPGHQKPGGYRTGPWLEALGPAYVSRAFKRAALADPRTRLVLNEAHCERDDRVGRDIRKGMLRLVDELLDQGLPLHAVGLQGHLQPEKRYSDAAFTDFLWRLHERGLNIYISEMDVRDGVYPANPKVRDKRVGARYAEFLGSVLKVPSVKAVICWQLADKYSWLYHMARRDAPNRSRLPRPLPFDENLQPKPAFKALLRAFKQRA